MKLSNSMFRTFIYVTMAAFFSTNLYSQQDAKAAEQEKTEAAKTDTAASNGNHLVGTYLDVAHAKSRANLYEQIVKEDIYKLQVVVANFGDENDKAALKKIMDEHVDGKKEFFKRQYLRADKILTGVRDQIEKLFQSMIARYQKQADDILGKCAENLVDLEIGMGSTRDVNTETQGRVTRKITENQIRLLTAYDQFNMAKKFQYEERLSDAITHYRLAKAHGINILIDLAETESDKDKVKNEYKVDRADADLTISK